MDHKSNGDFAPPVYRGWASPEPCALRQTTGSRSSHAHPRRAQRWTQRRRKRPPDLVNVSETFLCRLGCRQASGDPVLNHDSPVAEVLLELGADA
jgi:hypothetical protein